MQLAPPNVNFELVMASKGMSKGISQTEGIQVVGRGELSSGALFISVLGKNISHSDADGELQIATGGRANLGKAVLSISGTLKKWVVPEGHVQATAAEFAVSIVRPFGRITPRAQVVYSPNDLGNSIQSIYAEAGLSWQSSSHWQFSASVASRNRQGGVDYVAANVGAAYAFTNNFTAEVRAFGTNQASKGSSYEPRLVASLRARF